MGSGKLSGYCPNKYWLDAVAVPRRSVQTRDFDDFFMGALERHIVWKGDCLVRLLLEVLL
jgi:hypothetical protein